MFFLKTVMCESNCKLNKGLGVRVNLQENKVQMYEKNMNVLLDYEVLHLREKHNPSLHGTVLPTLAPVRRHCHDHGLEKGCLRRLKREKG